MDHQVLVIGGNHQNPLGVIEALGQKGINPYVIICEGDSNSFVLKSKYIKRGWVCPTDEEVIDCILKNFKGTGIQTIAIACCDNMASLLSENYEKLKHTLIIPGIPKEGALVEWMSKEKMIDVAQEIGINTPRTCLASKGNIPQDIEYPCVTKSLSSVKNGKSEFTLCNNYEELVSFIDEHVHSETIQIQKFIDKDFEFQYIGCSLNGGETIIIPGRTHIEATTHFNNLTFLRYQAEKVIKDPTTIQKAKEFVRRSGYSGLFSVEFMYGKDGKDYFLEMNFRNDGNGIVVTAAGTNLPYIWYLYNAGLNYQEEIAMSTVCTTYCAPEDSYFISMLEGDIPYKQWRKNMKKVTCYITYFKDDTAPFWALMWLQKRAIVASIVKCILRKFHLC